jgi:hypothetical protein
MSRRRSKNPTKAISITLKQSTIDKIDTMLSYKSSRSKYIQGCIDRVSESTDKIAAISNKELILELLYRKVIKNELYSILIDSISEDA